MVIKDFFEYTSTLLKLGLVNGWGITIEGHDIPNVIAAEIKNCLCIKLFNFVFYVLRVNLVFRKYFNSYTITFKKIKLVKRKV